MFSSHALPTSNQSAGHIKIRERAENMQCILSYCETDPLPRKKEEKLYKKGIIMLFPTGSL